MIRLLILCVFTVCAATSDDQQLCPGETVSTDFNDDPYPEGYDKMEAAAKEAATKEQLIEMEAHGAEEAKKASADAGHYHEMCLEERRSLRWYRGYWILSHYRIYYVKCRNVYCRFLHYYPCHGHGCGYPSHPFWPSYRCREERNYPVYAWGFRCHLNHCHIRLLEIWVPQACCCHMWHYWYDFRRELEVSPKSAACPAVRG